MSAGRGVGAYRNGQRMRLVAQPASQRFEGVRLVLSARLNFTRHLDEGYLFEALTRRYPNHPSQVLIEEAGGRYAVVRDFPAPDGERILGAVFGQATVVDDLVALFHENRVS